MAKIYTRTGDSGETGLRGGLRVPKSHPRVRVCGDLDELNCALGVALAGLQLSRGFSGLRKSLLRIQGEIFALGAVMSMPPKHAARSGSRHASGAEAGVGHGIPPEAIARLESEIDRWTAEIGPLNRFILPGGSVSGAWLHLARSVCRRAEREAAALKTQDAAPERMIAYLNRLSDFLFTAARWANHRLKILEIQWPGQPGQ